MIVNPKTLSWTAPTENVDGSPIDYDLNYEVGLVDIDTGDIVPIMTLPGSLNPDGRYEAPIDELMLNPGDYTLALRAYEKGNESRESAWSDSRVNFALMTVPTAPLDLKVS